MNATARALDSHRRFKTPAGNAVVNLAEETFHTIIRASNPTPANVRKGNRRGTLLQTLTERHPRVDDPPDGPNERRIENAERRVVPVARVVRTDLRERIVVRRVEHQALIEIHKVRRAWVRRAARAAALAAACDEVVFVRGPVVVSEEEIEGNQL